MWIILEPVIFALIGTEIQVNKIDPQTLVLGTAMLLGALVIRMIGTFFAVSCGTLNTKEKIFMAFAWMPKATVQGMVCIDILFFSPELATHPKHPPHSPKCNVNNRIESTTLRE